MARPTSRALRTFGKTMNSRVNYSMSLLNGNGYKNPTRSNRMDAEGRIGFVPVDGLTIALGFYSGKLGKDIDTSTTPSIHTAERETALLAYNKKALRIGLEYFNTDNWNQVTTAAKDSEGRQAGFYAFAGDHYSLTSAGGRHFCVGCHPGHSGMPLAQHRQAEQLGG